MFRPMDAMRERSEERRRNRKTPPTKQRHERDEQGWSKDYAECYFAPDYRQAVDRACKIAKVERFVPHALRHAFATWAANHPSLGAGAASAALNHRTRATTERDRLLDLGRSRPALFNAVEVINDTGRQGQGGLGRAPCRR